MLLKWYQLINRSVNDNHQINFLPGSDLIRSNVFFATRLTQWRNNGFLEVKEWDRHNELIR